MKMSGKLKALVKCLSSAIILAPAMLVQASALSPQTGDGLGKALPYIIAAIVVAIIVMAIILKRGGRPNDED